MAPDTLIYFLPLLFAMRFRGAIVSLLVLVALLGCVNPQPPTAPPAQAPAQGPGLIEAPAGLSGYNNLQYGVAMNYPAGWKSDESSPTLIVSFAPPGAATDGFTENVGLTMNDLREQPLTLDEYTAATLEQLPGALAGFSLVSSEASTLGSTPAQKLVYTFTLQDGTQIKALQVHTIRKGIAYTLVYINKPDQFSVHEASAQTIIDSFQVTKDL